MRMDIPEHLQCLFDRPANTWQANEKDSVLTWLFEEPQFKYLLYYCLAHLGSGANFQDAEDAWSDFYLSRMESILRLYDPSRGRRFWNYMLYCLENECRRYQKRLERREKREPPIERILSYKDQEIEISVEPTDSLDIQDILDIRLDLGLVNTCLAKLRPEHQLAFLYIVVQEMSDDEAAVRMQVKPGTVRVWAYRARTAIQKCLAVEEEAGDESTKYVH